MYHLFVILCLTGSPCVDDSRLIVKSENTFETTTACQVYSDTTFIPNVQEEFKKEYELFGAICVDENYIDLLKGKSYKTVKEGTNV